MLGTLVWGIELGCLDGEARSFVVGLRLPRMDYHILVRKLEGWFGSDSRKESIPKPVAISTEVARRASKFLCFRGKTFSV